MKKIFTPFSKLLISVLFRWLTVLACFLAVQYDLIPYYSWIILITVLTLFCSPETIGAFIDQIEDISSSTTENWAIIGLSEGSGDSYSTAHMLNFIFAALGTIFLVGIFIVFGAVKCGYLLLKDTIILILHWVRTARQRKSKYRHSNSKSRRQKNERTQTRVYYYV